MKVLLLYKIILIWISFLLCKLMFLMCLYIFIELEGKKVDHMDDINCLLDRIESTEKYIIIALLEYFFHKVLLYF